MRSIWNILIKGLAAILPVGLTIYLIYWLSVSIEAVLRPVFTAVVPEQYYWPGMGLVAGLVLLFFIGLAVNALIVQRLFQFGERLLERIPLIKSIYNTLRDFMDYFSTTQQRPDLKNVVIVSIGEAQLIGFVTRVDVKDIPNTLHSDVLVAVYLPFSYQIGGYTVYMPRSCVKSIDMSAEDAMRMIITAGLSKSSKAAKND
jgi:uncharacterized membrane protein